jgi:hypothetical protein
MYGSQTIFLFVLLAFQLLLRTSAAQTLVLRTGEIVAGKNIELMTNPHQVCLEVEDKVVCYPAEKVRGKVAKPNASLMYLMPKLGPNADKFDWEFMDHELEGNITLGNSTMYEATTIHGYNGKTTSYAKSIPVLVAEKGNIYDHVYDADFAETGVKNIKKLTQDVPGFDTRVDSLSDKSKQEQVIDLIRSYNFLTHQPFTSTPDLPNGVVVVYMKPSANATVVGVQVDGAKEYQLTAKSAVILTIPDNVVFKVCATSSQTSTCTLVRSTRCCRQYIQVTQNEKKGRLEMERADFVNAERYIKIGKSK